MMTFQKKKKRKQIGITGYNATDGMGDLAHMLTAGESLRKSLPDYDIVYQICWGIRDDASEVEDSRNRVLQLIDKLIFLKIIKDEKYDKTASARDLLKLINERNKDKIHLFTDRADYDSFVQDEGGDTFKEAELWVNVSYPIFDMDKNQELRFGGFSGKPGIFFFEHGEGSHFYPIEHMRKVPREDLHVMGFGTFTASDAKPTPGCGMFLDENSIKLNEETRTTALHNIKETIFHQFLYGADKVSLEDSRKTIEQTGFIPCYFIHGEIAGTNMVVAACENLFPNKKCVLVTGKISKETLFSKENLEKLKKAGFTRIEYFDAADKKASVEKDIIIQNLQATGPKRQGKILKVLSGCRLDEADFTNLMKLPEECVGCAGDNTLQQAIELGVLPIFTPHHEGKSMVLYNLAQFLKQNQNANKWQECIQFLECYKEVHGDGLGPHHPDKPMYRELPKYYTPEVLKQWKEVCQYLIQNQNLHQLLPKLVTDKLNTLSQQQETQPETSVKRKPSA